MSNSEPAAARKVARLERAAHLLERFHHELSAMESSARRTRLLGANRRAVEKLQQQTEKVKTTLRQKPSAQTR